MNFSTRTLLASVLSVVASLMSLPVKSESYREWYREQMIMNSILTEKICGQRNRTVDPRNANTCNSGYQNRQAPTSASTRNERTYWTCNNAVLIGIREGLIFEQSLADRALTDCIDRARGDFSRCSRAAESQMFGFGSKLPNYSEKIGNCEAKSLQSGHRDALSRFRSARLRMEDEKAFGDCMKAEGLEACRKRWDDEEREAGRELQ